MDYSFIWSIIHIYVPTINVEDEWLIGFITTFNLKSTEDSRENVIFCLDSGMTKLEISRKKMQLDCVPQETKVEQKDLTVSVNSVIWSLLIQPSSNQTDSYVHGHLQMEYSEIKLIINGQIKVEELKQNSKDCALFVCKLRQIKHFS